MQDTLSSPIYIHIRPSSLSRPFFFPPTWYPAPHTPHPLCILSLQPLPLKNVKKYGATCFHALTVDVEYLPNVWWLSWPPWPRIERPSTWRLKRWNNPWNNSPQGILLRKVIKKKETLVEIIRRRRKRRGWLYSDENDDDGYEKTSDIQRDRGGWNEPRIFLVRSSSKMGKNWYARFAPFSPVFLPVRLGVAMPSPTYNPPGDAERPTTSRGIPFSHWSPVSTRPQYILLYVYMYINIYVYTLYTYCYHVLFRSRRNSPLFTGFSQIPT